MKVLFSVLFLVLASAGMAAAQSDPLEPDVVVSDRAHTGLLTPVSTLWEMVNTRVAECMSGEGKKSQNQCLCESKGPLGALQEAVDAALLEHPEWTGKTVLFMRPGRDQTSNSTLDFKILNTIAQPAECSEEN